MPAKTRASTTSRAASQKLWKERVTPASDVLVVVKPACSPKTRVSTSAAALLEMQWPERYSGWGGVLRSDVKVGSGVRRLPLARP